MNRQLIIDASIKYKTNPNNITYYQNPDETIIFYKYAEYDPDGKIKGIYQPQVNKLGYIQLSICNKGPILKLISIT